MLIDFILPPIGSSGGIDVVYKYADLLIKRGHDVRVYKKIKASNMHRYKSAFVNGIHQAYCTVKTIFNYKKYSNKIDHFVWKITDKSIRDADVIIATAWPTAYKVDRLSPEKGEKFYFIQDFEIWDNEEIVKKSYELPLNKIVVSSWINQKLKQNLGIGPYPVVYNGLDTEIYHHVNIDKDTNSICFLMLNHTLPKKGVAEGIKVFEKIREKYPNSKLRMFGFCDSSNVPSYVEYHQNPTKAELVKMYSESDIFIFPSLEEGWGLTPLEAMACGCLVVGTNVGFVQDIGVHKGNMMISEPGHIEQMIRNIEELIVDKTLQKSIQNEMKNVIITLDWEKSVEKLEKIFSQQEG